MKIKKMLSLLVCMLVIVASVGAFTVSAAAKTITINVAKSSEAYTLPTGALTADDTTAVNVASWTDINNAAATTADISKVGYKLFTGQSGEDTVTLRLNVGEYKTVMFDDLSRHSTNAETGVQTIAALTGGTFSMPTYLKEGYTKDTSKGAQRIVNDNGNNALAIGPKDTGWTIKWMPATAQKGNVRLSFGVKVADFNLAMETPTSTSGLAFQMRLNDSSDITQFRITGKYTASNPIIELGGVRLRPYSYGAQDATGGNETGHMNLVKDTDYVVNNESRLKMTRWIPIEFEFKESGTYDIYQDAIKIASDWGMHSSWKTNGIQNVIFSKRNATVDAETYIDNFKIEKAEYVANNALASAAAPTATLVTGDDEAQTATIELAMTDGTTKEFAVNYTADTSATETGKTAVGRVEGIDETVTVTYNVIAGTKNKMITALVGETITFEDDTTLTPTETGVITRTVETDSAVYNYVINVGEFEELYKDDMESHTVKAATNEYEEGITPGAVAGFSSITSAQKTIGTMSGINNEDDSALVRTTNGADGKSTTALCYEQTAYKISASDNMKWQLETSVSGKYRVNLDLKYENCLGNGAAPIIRLSNKNGQQLTTGLSIRLQQNNSGSILGFVVSDGVLSNKNFARKGYLNETYFIDGIPFGESNTNPTTGWFRVSWVVDEASYDVLVNNVPVYENVEFSTSSATLLNTELGFISATCRQGGNVNGSTVYFDNLTISKFETKSKNYGVEFGTLVKGQSAGTANLARVGGDYNTAQALVACYNGDVLLNAGNLINISGIATGESKPIDLGITIPENATKIKMFIINDINSLQPIELVTEKIIV